MSKISTFFKRLFGISAPAVNPADDWKPIPEFKDKYLANRNGEIKNSYTGTIGKGTLNNRGYLIIHLSYKGKDYIRSVHRLVAEAFYGEIPNGLVISHINGNKTDNTVSNLVVNSRKSLTRTKFKDSISF